MSRIMTMDAIAHDEAVNCPANMARHKPPHEDFTNGEAMTMEKNMPSLKKTYPNAPALVATGPRGISILAGTEFNGFSFEADTPVEFDPESLAEGMDYAVTVADGKAWLTELTVVPVADDIMGGFHFAPGGNATGITGGDSIPAINPHSIWDRNFRPACKDPRGMTLVEVPGKDRFWCDIYLLGKDHLEHGTSRHGTAIADGVDLPQNPAGGTFHRFDYAAACAVMAHHGKQLLGAEEFFAATYGVTEKTAAPGEPKDTALDAPRTSRRGVMQATGNMWVWGTDGHPDVPRASVFGGSWRGDGHAGSRYASLDNWPDSSDGDIGARGRSDHLQPA